MRYKTLKAVAIWTICIVTGIVISLFLAQRYLGPEVKKLFIAEINKSLISEVQIDDVQLSLIKDFPYASVRFSGVRIKEALKTPSKNYLLIAGSISLRFNILALLKKNYSIKNIRLADVQIAPHVLPDGTDNFHFWKKSTSSDSKNLNFVLQRIIVHNLHLKYSNDASLTYINTTVPGFVAKGNFSSNNYALDLAGTIMLHEYKSQGVSYLSEKELNLWLSLHADNAKGLYSITKGAIETGKLKLTATGAVVYSQQQKQVDLRITASGSTLEEMLSLVPGKYLKVLEGYSFRGKGDIISKVSGYFGGNNIPAVFVQLAMQNGEIVEKKSGIMLSNVSALVAYSVKQDSKNETLSISNLNVKLGDGFIKGSWEMHGFSASKVLCNLNASVNLDEMHQFLNYDLFTSLKGWLKVNVAFDGQIADISLPTSDDFMNSNLSGSGSLQNASVSFKNYKLPLQNIESRFDFNGNDLDIQQLSFAAGRSDFKLRGTLGNLISWLFIKNESLSVTGVLSSQRLDWDELSGAQPGSSEEFRLILPEDISINALQIRINAFSLGKFNATNILGVANMSDKIVVVNTLSMLSCQGKVSGQLNINAQSEKHSILQARARLENVNVKTLFTQFGNFGQTDLQDQNLEGLVTADVIFAGVMKNNLEIDLNSIKAHADLKIENGRLVNYSPMKSLSRFLKVEDLTDIRFATLQNQIDIANQMIFIPAMEIKSSAIDLQLMGTHSFNNELNYHFTLALADLIASKFKRQNKGYDNQSEFGIIEDDGRGKTKIYVSLTGTVDDPIVKYDKKAMREKISNDLKEQKIELKQILKQEFIWLKGDTLKKAQQTKEKEIIKKQEQGKFVYEWDDDKK